MLSKLINFFSDSDTELQYYPVRHTFFRDPGIASQLHERGYCIVDFLGEKEKQQLIDIHEKYHKTKADGKGAFFGEMSEKIHYAIADVLQDSWDKWFKDYKSIINGYVVKTPGGAGKCPIHQDVADINELNYSSINIWIPLQDITPENGAIQIVPRSQYIFTPFRSATIDPLTVNIEDVLYPYFIPLYFKLGQVLFFDSRMFHYSPPNLSDQTRLVAFCRICPKAADVITYYMDRNSEGAQIEMYKCPEDYLIFSNSERDNKRPKNCEFLGYKGPNITPLTLREFEKKRKKLGIYAPSHLAS